MTTRTLVASGLASSFAGCALLALGFVVHGPAAVMTAYLVGFAFTASTLLGSLALLMIGHVTSASWFVVMRRAVEAVCAAIPLLIVFTVPLRIGLRWIYPWAAPAGLQTAALREALVQKGAYLSPTFFTVRAFVFVASWSLVATLLVRWSARTDATNALEMRKRMRMLSGGAMPWMGLTITFASFDWVMSLDPTWSSNAFGFYWFAGAFLAGIALTVLTFTRALRAATYPPTVGRSHVGALGRLQLASVVFWAYIAFVQLLILWMANLPEEASFYLVRVHGGWRAVSLGLAIAHFVLPFFALLQRRVTRHASRLAFVSAWLLALHAVDTYWLVEPVLHPDRPPVPWLDLAAVLALGGAVLAVAAVRAGSVAPVPSHDPLYARGLRYRAP